MYYSYAITTLITTLIYMSHDTYHKTTEFFFHDKSHIVCVSLVFKRVGPLISFRRGGINGPKFCDIFTHCFNNTHFCSAFLRVLLL